MKYHPRSETRGCKAKSASPVSGIAKWVQQQRDMIMLFRVRHDELNDNLRKESRER